MLPKLVEVVADGQNYNLINMTFPLKIIGLIKRKAFPIPNDYVAYYPFSGNADDQSGNGRNLTNIGATLTSDRKSNPNSAYYFTTNDYMYRDANWQSIIGNQFTITMWASIGATNQFLLNIANYYTGTNNSQVRLYHYNNFLRFEVRDVSANSSAAQLAISFSQLYFITIIRDGNNVFISLDNNINDSGSAVLGATESETLSLGAFHNLGGTGFFLTGDIDDVRIYNRVLTSDEITAIYNE